MLGCNLRARAKVPSILIADDSKFVQQTMTLPLQQAGYDLHVADNGLDALMLCAQVNPDLVIVDYQLPEVPGWEVCQLLRSNPETRNLPTIILSDDPQALNQAPQFGAHGTLSKPVIASELLNKVNGILAPMPEPTQPVTLVTEALAIPTVVSRVVPGKQISISLPAELLAQIKASFNPRDSIFIEYEPDDGVKVKREVAVSSMSSEELALSMGSKVAIEQRRRFFRKQIEVSVRYRLPKDFFRLGKTIDISGGGMRIGGIKGKIENGMTIDFQLALSTTMLLTVQGIIRRVIPKELDTFEIGVEFHDLSLDTQHELIMYLFRGKTSEAATSG